LGDVLDGVKFKMTFISFPQIVRMSFEEEQATITFAAQYPVISFRVGR